MGPSGAVTTPDLLHNDLIPLQSAGELGSYLVSCSVTDLRVESQTAIESRGIFPVHSCDEQNTRRGRGMLKWMLAGRGLTAEAVKEASKLNAGGTSSGSGHGPPPPAAAASADQSNLNADEVNYTLFRILGFRLWAKGFGVEVNYPPSKVQGFGVQLNDTPSFFLNPFYFNRFYFFKSHACIRTGAMSIHVVFLYIFRLVIPSDGSIYSPPKVCAPHRS